MKKLTERPNRMRYRIVKRTDWEQDSTTYTLQVFNFANNRWEIDNSIGCGGPDTDYSRIKFKFDALVRYEKRLDRAWVDNNGSLYRDEVVDEYTPEKTL